MELLMIQGETRYVCDTEGFACDGSRRMNVSYEEYDAYLMLELDTPDGRVRVALAREDIVWLVARAGQALMTM